MTPKYKIGDKVITVFNLLDVINLNEYTIKSFGYSPESGWYYSIQDNSLLKSGVTESDLFASKEDFLKHWDSELKNYYIEKARKECVSTLKQHQENLKYAQDSILKNEQRLININNGNFNL